MKEVENQGQHIFLEKLKNDKELQYTPIEIANDIINECNVNGDYSILDPSAGDNRVFYNGFPTEKKYYCEIEDGKDFFDWNEKIDWIIGNPPYRFFIGDKKYNGFPYFMEHSVKIADKGIGFLVNWKVFNAITTSRLNKWQPFNITKIKLYEVKKWFGRYYLVVFEKNKPSIITFENRITKLKT